MRRYGKIPDLPTAGPSAASAMVSRFFVNVRKVALS